MAQDDEVQSRDEEAKSELVQDAQVMAKEEAKADDGNVESDEEEGSISSDGDEPISVFGSSDAMKSGAVNASSNSGLSPTKPGRK